MIDCHTHFIPEAVQTWLRDHKEQLNAKWIPKGHDKTLLSINNKWAFPLTLPFIDINLYEKTYREAQVKQAIISPVPQLFLYDFESNVTNELVTVYNRALSEITSHNDTFSGLATVSLQNPVRAAEQLETAMNQGLLGAIIGPGVRTDTLSNERFIPFFEAANKRKALIFIHPLLNEDPRLSQRKMPNLIGVPFETTIAGTDLILSGMLDRFPDIHFLLAHGGGFLPYQLGRMEKGVDSWSSEYNHLSRRPLEYAKQLYFDSVLWSDDAMELLVKTVGVSQIIPGSDFPFELKQWPLGPESANTRPRFLQVNQPSK
ncbi:amidohydrolase family protein [Bacillus sp. JCM 19041]|uniref:amidohydrolase family protein n=1 Tax=Bacillus sp. JCM 19041 TaxID=1460637 RepID=UPI0009E9E7C7